MQVFATSPAAVYTGLGNAFTRISSTEGVRVLWRGVSSVIMGAGPAHAVHFGTYEAIKELTGGNREGSPNQLLSAFNILTPVEVFVLPDFRGWLREAED
jgi:solute carrier family 25 (mitochondrial iron transporter), member 28/37